MHYLNPSCLQATSASAFSQPISQIRPKSPPPVLTSTRPSYLASTSLLSPASWMSMELGKSFDSVIDLIFCKKKTLINIRAFQPIPLVPRKNDDEASSNFWSFGFLYSKTTKFLMLWNTKSRKNDKLSSNNSLKNSMWKPIMIKGLKIVLPQSNSSVPSEQSLTPSHIFFCSRHWFPHLKWAQSGKYGLTKLLKNDDWTEFRKV